MSRREDGHALLVALFVIVVMMAAHAMIAGSLAHRMALLRREARSVQLTALADAALAEALAELSQDPDYRGTRGPRPFGGGTIASEVRRLGATGAVVEVRATYAGGGRAARAEVNLLPLEVTRWEPVPFRR